MIDFPRFMAESREKESYNYSIIALVRNLIFTEQLVARLFSKIISNFINTLDKY